jgi:hypothetical protein
MSEMTGACCAHLTVKWVTEKLPKGLTRGWWECVLCKTPFAPALASRSLEIIGRIFALDAGWDGR